MFCYTKSSVGPGPTTWLPPSSLQSLVATLANRRSTAAHQWAGRAYETGGRFLQMNWNCGVFSHKSQMPPFPLSNTQGFVCTWKKNPSKSWEGRWCCCYFKNCRNMQPRGPDRTLKSAKELMFIRRASGPLTRQTGSLGSHSCRSATLGFAKAQGALGRSRSPWVLFLSLGQAVWRLVEM